MNSKLSSAPFMMAVAERGVDDALAAEFEATLRQAVDEFAARFEGPAPAFLFVEEEQWRWLLPIHPAMAHYKIVRRGAVGSRSVLLVANESGAAELAAQEKSPA